MNTSATKARAGIVIRVRSYFEANPTEELTFRFVRDKFGCTLWSARKAVYALVEAGFLESVHVIRRREQGMAQEEETHL